MKKAVIVVAVLASVVAAGFLGCGGNGGGSGDVKPAMAFHEDVPKYYSKQVKCPVCGGQPLVKDHYVDVEGQRVYFDKKDCVAAFKKNQSTYLRKLRP